MNEDLGAYCINYSKIKYLIIGLITAVVLLSITISSSSLWIDEATTAYLASQKSPREAWNEVYAMKESELQMPGYIFYVWSWEKIFGHSEVSLRWASAPFILLYFACLSLIPMKNSARWWLFLLSCIHPFLWYNLNEARSTIILFCLSGIITAWAVFSEEKLLENKNTIWIIAIVFSIGLLMNMLFFFFVPIVLFLIIYTMHKKEIKIPTWIWGPCLFTLLAGGFSLPYYWWTVKQGAGGMIQKPSVMNLAFSLYELLGFSGLGPPRNILRGSAQLSTFIPYLKPIALTLGAYGGLILIYLIHLRREKILTQWYDRRAIIGFILGCAIFVLLASVAHFRFLGRHMIFMLPLLLIAIAEMMVSITNNSLKERPLEYIIILLLFICLGLSSYNMRFNSSYAKDDYKNAVNQAITMTSIKEGILWAGSSMAGMYYGIEFVDGQQPNVWPYRRHAINISNIENINTIDSLIKSGPSTLIIFKKPDLYDKHNSVNSYLSQNKLMPSLDTQDYQIFRIYPRQFNKTNYVK